MRRWSGLFAISLCICLGCSSNGPQTYPVTGHVKYKDGKPLVAATVEFQSAGGGVDGKSISARGVTQSDGAYEISTFAPGDGAIAGKHRVLVISPLPPGEINPNKPPKPFIHPRFQRYDSSGLEYTVDPDGDNTFDITVDPP